jgi:hypothetical protein
MRCERASLEVVPGALHEAPEDAGLCSFQIRGSEGARFPPFEPPSVEPRASDSL